MKILITGTKGFIAGRLLHRLKNIFVCFEINEDIFELTEWESMLKENLTNIQPDAIFHIGACSDTLELNVNYIMTRNFEFTKIISDYSKEKNIPFIYSSSAANYGVNEKHPANLYGWSKYVSEQYVLINGGVALRYFNVYGPGEEHKGKMASIAYQMWTKRNNNEIVNIFPGKPKRDFVYVEDIIDANLEAYKNYNQYKFNWFDVGCGEARTFEDVLEIMNIPFQYTPPSSIPEGYQFFTKSNPKKWMKNWTPKYNLEKGIKEYLIYLKNEKI